MKPRHSDRWIAAAVLAHLLIAFVHGFAHSGGHVAVTPGQSLFVFTIILIGPVGGLVLSYVSPRAGGLIVAATMAGSLVFGLANHFLIAGPDHVGQVAADWRGLFTASAILLVVSETAGTVAGLRCAASVPRRSVS